MTWQGHEGMNEFDAILTRLTRTDNAAAAHADAAIADLIERIEMVLERPSGDDPAIIFGRGVDIMIVIVQPVLGQFTRLPLWDGPPLFLGIGYDAGVWKRKGADRCLS